jgi:hypothetical protein
MPGRCTEAIGVGRDRWLARPSRRSRDCTERVSGYTSKHGLEPGRRRIDAPANKWLLGPPSGSAAFACPRGRWLREQVPGNRSCVVATGRSRVGHAGWIVELELANTRYANVRLQVVSGS